MPMPRSRGSSEIPQHESPRLSLHIRTTASSEANHSTGRRGPKVNEQHHAQRGPHYHHDENKKQCRTRVSDLAKKLAEAQEELKKLTEQLATTEAAKKDTQQELEKTKSKIPLPCPSSSSSSSNVIKDEKPEVQEDESFNSSAADVFEVVPASSVQTNDSEEEELHKRNAEITELNAKIEALAVENEGLKKQVEEAKEIDTKLVKLEVELRNSEMRVASLEEKVEVLEGEKEGLDEEMKRLRAQAEQWRKAAEEAAVVLSAGYEGGNNGGGGRGGRGMKMFGELWKKMGQK